ncbi:MAG: HAD-IB family hydrolase [Ilumatobacteraceae bacterium]
MGQGAAFFDLDRTLVAGASGQVFGRALREAGLLGRAVPGEDLIYGVFERVGENLPSIALARRAASMARGTSSAAVQAAALEAVPELVGRLQPFAGRLFAEHRLAGRPLVLATTTPYDLVAPLAAALGFDDVLATRYGKDDEGTYDGTIDGPFVWSQGKLAAARDWADGRGIDLADRYAYSDSVFDTPLLAAVGHPVAVNPDPRMVLMAVARRWPVLHLDVPPGVQQVPVLGQELQRVAFEFLHPLLFPYARFTLDGVDRLPVDGAAIIVANHRSYFDVITMALLFARRKRPVRFLGKRELFDVPVAGQFLLAMGGIPVDRGSGSGTPLAAATEALQAGEVVAIMPEGTIPRGEKFFSTTLQGRPGAARLAAATRAPVIPVGLWGTERVWPRSSRLPHVWNVTSPPRVTATVGEPVELKYRSESADTKRIMAAITALLPDEARVRHRPTPAELALTYPPGHAPDPAPAP